jgi:thioredoxin 1
MAKFGELIAGKKPVLFDFYISNEETINDATVMETVAAALGDKALVIRINIDDNTSLAKALRIKTNPTYIIYKSEEMIWRQSEIQDANTLINAVLEFV